MADAPLKRWGERKQTWLEWFVSSEEGPLYGINAAIMGWV